MGGEREFDAGWTIDLFGSEASLSAAGKLAPLVENLKYATPGAKGWIALKEKDRAKDVIDGHPGSFWT